MTEKITLEEALRLVFFIKDNDGKWCVGSVRGDVAGTVRGHVHGDVGATVGGNVRGNVLGSVGGTVGGNVRGNVRGNVGGKVWGTISRKEWTFVETPRETLARLIKEKGDEELIKAFNELEDSDD